ncbi:DUF2169 family type VI secretion system accessory protein [Cereibacter sphaeroides]|uniref:DUF2169 family type VI secretion system accessory protein n=1 Tax=Cereibacter sphaeroides TaxID=1063 RepID=UPI003FCCA29C
MRIDNATPWPATFTMAFDAAGHEQVVLVTKASFALPRGTGPCRPAEPLPLIESDLFGADPAADAPVQEYDFAPHKPFCDVLLHGRAHAPEGRPVTELPVGLRLGGWSKRLTVRGARIWLRAAAGWRVSDPRPFTSQPIGYDHAYGGTDPDPGSGGRAAVFEENPAGLGFYPLRPDREGAPLPHTAEAGADATDPRGGLRPMALGPVGRTWLPRRRHAGTYDAAYFESRTPFLPLDFDPRYFQAAAEDQQIPYPKGGEPVELVNLSPRGRIATWLPRLQILATFERRSGRLTQRIANLDTVLFLPEEEIVTLTFRTRITAERDIFEFARVLVSARQEAPDG